MIAQTMSGSFQAAISRSGPAQAEDEGELHGASLGQRQERPEGQTREVRPAPRRGTISIAKPITITMIPRIQLTSSASTIPTMMSISGSVMATGVPEAESRQTLRPG